MDADTAAGLPATAVKAASALPKAKVILPEHRVAFFPVSRIAALRALTRSTVLLRLFLTLTDTAVMTRQGCILIQDKPQEPNIHSTS